MQKPQFVVVVFLGVQPQEVAGSSHPCPTTQIYTHIANQELENALKSFRQPSNGGSGMKPLCGSGCVPKTGPYGVSEAAVSLRKGRACSLSNTIGLLDGAEYDG